MKRGEIPWNNFCLRKYGYTLKKELLKRAVIHKLTELTYCSKRSEKPLWIHTKPGKV